MLVYMHQLIHNVYKRDYSWFMKTMWLFMLPLDEYVMIGYNEVISDIKYEILCFSWLLIYIRNTTQYFWQLC